MSNFFTGGITTNAVVSGIKTDLNISFIYPNQNASSYEGIEQPISPPIELLLVHARVTQDKKALTNPDDTTIKWFSVTKATPDETAVYNEESETWQGLEDSISLEGIPVKKYWFYQLQVSGKNGVWSDFTAVRSIIDQPEPLPIPVMNDLLTNEHGHVLASWSDESRNVSNFSGYEVHKREINVSSRESVSALIVGSN